MSAPENSDTGAETMPTTPAAATRATWSDADRRLLLITVAGCLAANLGTVLLVGCAIVLDRYLQ